MSSQYPFCPSNYLKLRREKMCGEDDYELSNFKGRKITSHNITCNNISI